MLHRIRERFRKLKMRTRLFWSFSMFIMALLLVIAFIANALAGRENRSRILHSAEQSFVQAGSFLQNKIDMMMYVSDLIYYNGDLQRVLQSSAFRDERNAADQYREFLLLDRVFMRVEMTNSVLFTRIYIPDEILYTNNIKHFIGDSALKARADYGQFTRESEQEMAFFTLPEDVALPNLPDPVNAVSLLRVVRAADGSAEPLCVEQVAVPTGQFQSIIDNSDITTSGLTALVNRHGQLICASDGSNPLLADLDSLDETAGDDGWAQVAISGSAYQLRQASLPSSGWRVISLIPESEIQRQGRQITAALLLIMLAAIAAASVISYLFAAHYTKHLDALNGMMREVRTGNLDVPVSQAGTAELDQIFRSFAYMTRELKTLMEEKYRSGAAIKSAQFRALQAQINPHFLYNTLDLINWQAMDAQAPSIAEIAQSLASFYRITLNRGQQIVTVEEELNLILAYVSIENRHFNGAIVLRLDVPDEIRSLSCINILLQPFVENAIMHGIAANLTIAECNISISARLKGGDILFTIQDDGMGMTQRQIDELTADRPENSSHGYGIRNIQQRIRLCYGEEYGLVFTSSPGQGTTVLLRIPALTIEEARLRVQ